MELRRPIAGLGLLVVACASDPTLFEGEFGRAVPLASGDASPLPRLAFIDEGCPGASARSGCDPANGRPCELALIDTLSPLTVLKSEREDAPLSFGRECLELRQAQGLASATPTEEAQDRSVARFRFRDLPVVRAPADGGQAFSWAAGDADALVEPGAVLGGNLLRQFAVLLRRPPLGGARVALYGEFPGTDRNLADEGFTFVPVQFPGRLLGRDLADRCDIGGQDCALGGFDIQGNPDLALEASRMVLDACVAMPPCGVSYALTDNNPFAPGTCFASRGDALDATEGACVPADDPDAGGKQASLVVATGVPGLVLFDDSARRMFGPLENLPDCGAIEADTPACVLGLDGSLSISGWPPAPSGDDPPLLRLAVRSVGLLPGLTRTRGPGPCVRAQQRASALLNQCEAFVADFEARGNVEDTSTPHAAEDSDAGLAVLGETRFDPGQREPEPDRWLDTTVLPETHPMVLALRRDVAPEALQPDGLLGASVFEDSVTVLDYTDPNPGVRLQCLDPRSGDCLSAPNCSADGQGACCHGLPLSLLFEIIVQARDDTCCGALSAEELREIQEDGFCRGEAPS
ncbi:MAG: hypothetical protein ACE37F_12745 [Nannocystaceae bacterium]|nr:hypothetical protein [bacterium]